MRTPAVLDRAGLERLLRGHRREALVVERCGSSPGRRRPPLRSGSSPIPPSPARSRSTSTSPSSPRSSPRPGAAPARPPRGRSPLPLRPPRLSARRARSLRPEPARRRRYLVRVERPPPQAASARYLAPRTGPTSAGSAPAHLGILVDHRRILACLPPAAPTSSPGTPTRPPQGASSAPLALLGRTSLPSPSPSGPRLDVLFLFLICYYENEYSRKSILVMASSNSTHYHDPILRTFFD
jgi:hypothetical protein